MTSDCRRLPGELMIAGRQATDVARENELQKPAAQLKESSNPVKYAAVACSSSFSRTCTGRQAGSHSEKKENHKPAVVTLHGLWPLGCSCPCQTFCRSPFTIVPRRRTECSQPSVAYVIISVDRHSVHRVRMQGSLLHKQCNRFDPRVTQHRPCLKRSCLSPCSYGPWRSSQLRSQCNSRPRTGLTRVATPNTDVATTGGKKEIEGPSTDPSVIYERLKRVSES